MSKDWGLISFGALVRKIDQGGMDEVGAAFNIAGKISTFGKDDFRFQATAGEAGRYVAAGMTPDIVENPVDEQMEVESTLAFAIAYRHFWTDSLRSTIFYGAAETDVLERKRSHWGVNLIDSITDHLDVGLEVGNYAIDDQNIKGIDSHYLQFSATYKL